jgi:hypothetical protein
MLGRSGVIMNGVRTWLWASVDDKSRLRAMNGTHCLISIVRILRRRAGGLQSEFIHAGSVKQCRVVTSKMAWFCLGLFGEYHHRMNKKIELVHDSQAPYLDDGGRICCHRRNSVQIDAPLVLHRHVSLESLQQARHAQY